jgi:hypothetical protein
VSHNQQPQERGGEGGEDVSVTELEAKNTMKRGSASCKLCFDERFVIDTSWWKASALRVMAYLSIFVNWLNKKIGEFARADDPVILHCPKCSTGLPAKVGEWGPFSSGNAYRPKRILRVPTRGELLSGVDSYSEKMVMSDSQRDTEIARSRGFVPPAGKPRQGDAGKE